MLSLQHINLLLVSAVRIGRIKISIAFKMATKRINCRVTRPFLRQLTPVNVHILAFSGFSQMK